MIDELELALGYDLQKASYVEVIRLGDDQY